MISLDECDWSGHPKGRPEDPDGIAMLEARNAGTLEIHGLIADAEAYYSYEDFALCRLPDGRWAIAHTSGCSCPSPTELTWSVCCAGTAEEIADWLVGFVGGEETWENRMGKRQAAEFLAWIDIVRGTTEVRDGF